MFLPFFWHCVSAFAIVNVYFVSANVSDVPVWPFKQHQMFSLFLFSSKLELNMCCDVYLTQAMRQFWIKHSFDSNSTREKKERPRLKAGLMEAVHVEWTWNINNERPGAA